MDDVLFHLTAPHKMLSVAYFFTFEPHFNTFVNAFRCIWTVLLFIWDVFISFYRISFYLQCIDYISYEPRLIKRTRLKSSVFRSNIPTASQCIISQCLVSRHCSYFSFYGCNLFNIPHMPLFRLNGVFSHLSAVSFHVLITVHYTWVTVHSFDPAFVPLPSYIICFTPFWYFIWTLSFRIAYIPLYLNRRLFAWTAWCSALGSLIP